VHAHHTLQRTGGQRCSTTRGSRHGSVGVRPPPLSSALGFLTHYPATFTLGSASNGINPVTEPFTLQVGPFARTIPAGSFQQDKKGQFAFKGTINEVSLEVQITPLNSNAFAFNAKGKDADLTGTVNPMTVGLTIGDDTGSVSVTAEFK
jgi:hypothetical protein